METKHLISIGLPCYNVEKYIDRCISSLLNQTYKNTEIILIDDGSEDSTGFILDKYAKTNDNIRVIHQTNSGVSSSRNVFLNHANGDYIYFVDPDDYIAENLIEKVYRYSIDNQCDLVLFGRYNVYPNGSITENIPIAQTGIINKNEIMRLLLADKIQSHLWQKFYKKELWENIRFSTDRVYGEDIAVLHRVFENANRIGNIPLPLYYYQINENSLTTSYRPFKWMSLYLAFRERYEFAHEKYPQYEDIIKSNTLNIARLTNDNYILKKELCDKPYIAAVRRFIKCNIAFSIKTPHIKWYNKLLIVYYYLFPTTYSFTIKYIHKAYYHFKPNKFR